MKRLGLGALLALSTPAAAQTVHTVQGEISGTTLASGVEAWLGIPFAAPPVGALRWKPPQAPARWDRPYLATHFAPSCMQPLRDHGIAYYVGDDPIAEDCLYLNVWAPKSTRPDAKLPVIVYVYGGSFVAGSARKPLYLGDALAAKGAIVVGFNYRLGALGFLAHPELTAESRDHASGNYGLLDQIAALEWVRDNIAAFGGDPARVTIMGQSAGAISIALLQASPRAKGLFQRIIALSGSPYMSPATSRIQSRASGEAAGLAFQQRMGAADLSAMRRLPADRMVDAQGPIAMPIIDGLAVTRDPAEVYAARAQSDVPILIGTVRDEALSPLAAATTLSDYRAALTKSFGERADLVQTLYPARSDAEAQGVARSLAHDLGFSSMMRSWAQMQSANSHSPVYAYWFDRRHPYATGVRFSDLDPGTTGINHTDDVPYWLGTFESLNAPRRTRDWTAADRALADRMQAALIAFAATGDPNGPGLGVRWPRYDPKSERMLGLGDTVRTLVWPDRDRMDKLAELGIPEARTAKDQKK